MIRKTSLMVLLGLSLAACGDETPDDGKDGDTDTDTDTDTTGTDTDDDEEPGEDEDDGGGGGDEFFEPAAIGFEYVGGWDPDENELTGWTYSDETAAENFVRVTITDVEFFSLSGDEQLGHYCEMYFTFDHAYDPDVVAFDAFDSEAANPWAEPGAQADLWGSWSGTLTEARYSLDTEDVCLNFDPDEWVGLEDPDTGDVLVPAGTPFVVLEGMQFTLGFGALSPYMTDLWSDSEDFAEYEDSLFTTYVGMNLPNVDTGETQLYAHDWSYGILWEWEDIGGMVVTDDEDFLVPVDHADGRQDGFVGSYAYWYHDWPYVDLSILQD